MRCILYQNDFKIAYCVVESARGGLLGKCSWQYMFLRETCSTINTCLCSLCVRRYITKLYYRFIFFPSSLRCFDKYAV